MPEGRQSPPPERQSGRQVHETPGQGQDTQNIDSNAKKSEQEDQLKNLDSNPKGALDDALESKFNKTTKAGE